jgi:hypothetical protein
LILSYVFDLLQLQNESRFAGRIFFLDHEIGVSARNQTYAAYEMTYSLTILKKKTIFQATLQRARLIFKKKRKKLSNTYILPSMKYFLNF